MGLSGTRLSRNSWSATFFSWNSVCPTLESASAFVYSKGLQTRPDPEGVDMQHRSENGQRQEDGMRKGGKGGGKGRGKGSKGAPLPTILCVYFVSAPLSFLELDLLVHLIAQPGVCGVVIFCSPQEDTVATSVLMTLVRRSMPSDLDQHVIIERGSKAAGSTIGYTRRKFITAKARALTADMPTGSRLSVREVLWAGDPLLLGERPEEPGRGLWVIPEPGAPPVPNGYDVLRGFPLSKPRMRAHLFTALVAEVAQPPVPLPEQLLAAYDPLVVEASRVALGLPVPLRAATADASEKRHPVIVFVSPEIVWKELPEQLAHRIGAQYYDMDSFYRAGNRMQIANWLKPGNQFGDPEYEFYISSLCSFVHLCASRVAKTRPVVINNMSLGYMRSYASASALLIDLVVLPESHPGNRGNFNPVFVGARAVFVAPDVPTDDACAVIAERAGVERPEDADSGPDHAMDDLVREIVAQMGSVAIQPEARLVDA